MIQILLELIKSREAWKRLFTIGMAILLIMVICNIAHGLRDSGRRLDPFTPIPIGCKIDSVTIDTVTIVKVDTIVKYKVITVESLPVNNSAAAMKLIAAGDFKSLWPEWVSWDSTFVNGFYAECRFNTYNGVWKNRFILPETEVNTDIARDRFVKVETTQMVNAQPVLLLSLFDKYELGNYYGAAVDYNFLYFGNLNMYGRAETITTSDFRKFNARAEIGFKLKIL